MRRRALLSERRQDPRFSAGTPLRPGARRLAGFTLIEVIVAVGILGVIVAIVSATFSGALGAQSAADRRTETTHAARTALDRIAQDLGSAFPYAPQARGTIPIGLELSHQELEGASRDRLTFPTYGRPFGSAGEPSSDLALVEYELIVSDDRRAWRLVRRQANRLEAEAIAQAPGDVVAERVVGFEVKLFDGKDWVATWTDKTKLPRAVELTIRVAPEPQPGASRPWGEGPLSEARTLTYGTRTVLPLAKPS